MSLQHSVPSRSGRKATANLRLNLNRISSSGSIVQRQEECSDSRKKQLSRRSLPMRTGAWHGRIPDLSPSFQVSPQRDGSNFAPMDAASLGASIEKEQRWARRSPSPRQERMSRPNNTEKYVNCQQRRVSCQGDAVITGNHDKEFNVPTDMDLEAASEDEEQRSYLLGVCTPSTLRRMKLKMSLDPVRESEDEDAEGKCPSAEDGTARLCG